MRLRGMISARRAPFSVRCHLNRDDSLSVDCLLIAALGACCRSCCDDWFVAIGLSQNLDVCAALAAPARDQRNDVHSELSQPGRECYR
jgi:hypothetical protein